MILIFTQKVTPRITYTFHQVLGHILGFEIAFTTKIEEFIAYKGTKFSYGKSKMGNEFFVKASGLLTEQGVTDVDIMLHTWDDAPCFFQVGEESAVPFDLFSASFYLLSRYEEYLPHVKASGGRYPAEESLAYKHKFLQKPVIDIWAYKFKAALQIHFPKENFPTRRFTTKNILAVSEVYKYSKKGVVRNMVGGFQDLFSLNLKSFFTRIRTQLLLTRDPYDIYKKLLRYSKQRDIIWYFMFQLSDYSTHNKNVNHNSSKYHTLIKSMGDYGKIGLLLGYEAIFDIKILKKEKKRWENIANRDLEMALKDDYGLNLPQLYNNYDTLEIGHDYSMGYIDKIGFRAGTCSPFLYYDLNFERISPLLIHPAAFNSDTFKTHSFFEVKTWLERLKKEVQAVDGQLLMLYKNSDFAETSANSEKYFQLLEKMNEN